MIREYVLRLHDPVNVIEREKRVTFATRYVRSTTPPIVPRVGEEVDIGNASYVEAGKARYADNRVKVVTRVAHYLECGAEGHVEVDHIDVYTEWQPPRHAIPSA